MELPTIDLVEFERLAKAPGVLVLDFTAEHCGPCRAMLPILHALADEYAGRVRIVAVDVDHEQILAAQCSVRSTPTLVLWAEGREVGRLVGSRPRAFIAGMLDRALAGDRAIASP